MSAQRAIHRMSEFKHDASNKSNRNMSLPDDKKIAEKNDYTTAAKHFPLLRRRKTYFFQKIFPIKNSAL